MSSAKTVAVSGATGFVGSRLVEELETDGVRVLRLVRHAPKDPAKEVCWDPTGGAFDASALEGVDTVFHLAGKGIADERWNARVKREIVDSRVLGTRGLSEALSRLENKPRVMVCASATGFYGDRGSEAVDEDSQAGVGFLADTCKEWEAASQPAWEAGIRVVQTRIGMVLSPEGGALAKLVPVFKLGAGGVVGRGDQVISWIALPDLIRILRFVADNDAVHGAVNATAPHPVTNRAFTKALGKQLGRPTLIPTPAGALRIAMGEMAGPLLLEGARVLPKRLSEAGFQFETPTIDEALGRVLG